MTTITTVYMLSKALVNDNSLERTLQKKWGTNNSLKGLSYSFKR